MVFLIKSLRAGVEELFLENYWKISRCFLTVD